MPFCRSAGYALSGTTFSVREKPLPAETTSPAVMLSPNAT